MSIEKICGAMTDEKGKSNAKPDMSPVWNDASELLDDIEGGLACCIAIANALHNELEDLENPYTDLAAALLLDLNRLSKDTTQRHSAECMAAKQIAAEG